MASNFSPEHINEAVSLPVCVILHRLHDNRIGEYVKKYSSYLESHADTHERTMLFGAVNPGSREVLLRTYREGDEYALVGLFQKIFGREMTVDEWTWKYKGQGSISVPSTVAVNNIGEIVGHYGGIPLRAVHDNREVKILSTCDVMVHPAFRGFWMLRKLTAFFRKEALNKGFKMCYGFPTEQTLLLPGEKLKILERCLRLSEARKAAGFNNNAARFFYRLSPMDYSDPRINTLWKIFKKSHSFSAVRDCSFLIWRYQKNPIFSYQIWGLTRRWDRKLYGVAVVRNDPSDDMIIMDLVFEERALPALLIKLENLAFTSGKKTTNHH